MGLEVPGLGFHLDLSTMPVTADDEQRLTPAFDAAFAAMAALERGAVANPDEGRQVGHYWLRAPERAPSAEQRDAIESTLARVLEFGEAVREGRIGPPEGGRFEHVLHVGIGGSALGPQLVADALSGPADALGIDFLDNTDPEGFARTLSRLRDRLDRVLVLVVSKSGGTPETRNGMEETIAALKGAGLQPAGRLVAITGEGSALHQRAGDEGWLEVFPMWDWVGGRTSVTSAVGLLPMSLLGYDVRGFLAGAAAMDEATRVPELQTNPAARLALAWHVAAAGQAERDLVVLPYKDRLLLLSRYLQQLVMESLGKAHDLEGREVRQGLTVYGNKGSTDQHAFVQQLRDGADNYFALLIGVLDDAAGPSPLEVEPAITSGDYLLGFLLGTRRALAEGGRQVMTLMVPRVDARTLGALIALSERAVGLYASLVGINAYHQPGVEAGKKAAAHVLDLQRELLAAMGEASGTTGTAREWSERIGRGEDAVEALWVLEHLASHPARGVRREGPTASPVARFGMVGG
jgi:glucose-6-phosphate isomerase